MSGLSYICDYGNESESDDCDADSQKIDLKKTKLPVPNLSDIVSVLADDHTDNPELYQGRIRSFPHVRGNWATFVYIKYPEEQSLVSLAKNLQRLLLDFEENCYICDDFHLSLSKTVVLNYHTISVFRQSLKEALSDSERFNLGFTNLEVFCNEEKTRTFIVLKADYFSKKSLLPILEKVNDILGEFKLDKFYDDPSFHISLLWTNGDQRPKLRAILEDYKEDILKGEVEKTVEESVLIDKVSKMERSLNKVYINPNFNQRSSVNPMPQQPKSCMHVNPNFPQMHIHNNLEPNVSLTKRRIFVNPNFVPQNYTLSTGMNNVYQNVAQPFYATVNNNDCPTMQIRYGENSSLHTAKEIPKPTVQPSVSSSVSKSRYTLVRSNTDASTNKIEQPVNKNSCTIKINKYKTARLSYIKDNQRIMDKTKELTRELSSSSHINRLLPTEPLKTQICSSNSNRKYVKINRNSPLMKKVPEMKLTITKRISQIRKNTLSTNFRINRKIISGKFKKNNIPCPLFSKYGKCLRNIHGNCEFLHDKKHVSLCRKFLKGICHDTACPFSHELSAKKMPTCYFYLNGMCTKDNCPYLHVKLNSETKICNDFLKGYCEKGDKCDFRHVNKGLQSFIRRSMNIQRQYTCSSPVVVCKSKIKIKQNINKKNDMKRKSLSNSKLSSNDTTETECRYFKETNSTDNQNEACDVIKPSRCKLGTLPSFIKL